MGYELYPKILKVYDEQGNKIEIGAIKGEQGKQGKQGEPGKDAVTDLKFDPKSKNAQSGIAIAEELQRPEFRTLRVDIQVSPISRTEFYSNYSSTEIKNFVDAGGDVEAHFEDTIRDTGDQIYQYAKYVQNEKKVYFFRPFSDEKSVSRIALTIDENKNANFTEVVYDGATTSYVNEKLSEKVDHSVVVVNDSTITQADARDVLEFAENYSGALIEFVSSSLSRTVGFGFVISNTDIFLITIDYNGIITQWHKDSFEKHYIESYSYINEVIDIDNLTVDVAGNAPFMASVNNAFNRPFKETTSEKGKVFVIPYSIDCQVQAYMDMKSMKMYSRLVEGTADNHSFGVWQEMGGGVSQEYVEQNFANIIRNEAEGTVISVNDVSPFPQIVETKAESKNIIKISDINTANPKLYNIFMENGLSLKRDESITLSISNNYSSSQIEIIIKEFGTNRTLMNRYDVTTYSYTATDDIKIYFQLYNSSPLPSANDIEFQVEKGTVATPYTPYIPDLTQARLSVVGTNLFNIKDVKDVAVNTAGAIRSGVKIKMPKGTFTFTAKNGNNSLFIKTQYGKDFGEAIGLGNKFVTVNMRENGYVIIYTSSVEAFNQLANEGILASGDKPGDYIPYQETIYTPTESGTVSNVQSVSPNMTAFGEGLYVSMKYNADTNKVVENLQSQIEELKKVALSLGGNI